MLWCFWLLGLSARRSRGAGRLDGIDRNERHGKQFTDTLDIVGAGLTGEEAVVADAVAAILAFANVRLSPFKSWNYLIKWPWRPFI